MNDRDSLNGGDHSAIFRGRAHCAAALANTLHAFVGQDDVTEIGFQRAWMKEVARGGEMTESGWYCPPPFGAAVLAGTVCDPSRLGFRSLRDEAAFPRERTIEWRNGLLFVYCSNVFTPLGMPSDFSTTLYFGQNQRFTQHLIGAAACARSVADLSLNLQSSRELFAAAQEILASSGFANTVHSITDMTPLDYGHSLERLSESDVERRQLHKANKLNPALCRQISRSRKFINHLADWRLDEVDAYTVEPQMIALDDPGLPKVTFHYLITQRGGRAIEDSIESFLPTGAVGASLAARVA